MNPLHAFLGHHGRDAILVRVVDAKGSTPREAGATMAVSRDAMWGTIGGGRLEFEAIIAARAMLERDPSPHDRHIVDQPLGPTLGQCCGGRVRLEMRRAGDRDRAAAMAKARDEWSGQPRVLVFGAGHVGVALAAALRPLPLRTTVIDERIDAIRGLPPEVDWELAAVPESFVRSAEPATCFIILTHDHALDFQLAKAALERGDAAYVGMIGSLTKRARFISYAAGEGMSRDVSERLICPMAPHARRDKRPTVIAAFVAAEVLGAALRARGAGVVADRPLARHRPAIPPA